MAEDDSFLGGLLNGVIWGQAISMITAFAFCYFFKDVVNSLGSK